MPEVSLVAILDADKEGFLRSEGSLIQTIGRAARNAHGKVIMYADKVTGSMRRAIDETERRRTAQDAYNRANGIVPKTIVKEIRDPIEVTLKDDAAHVSDVRKATEGKEKEAGRKADRRNEARSKGTGLRDCRRTA